MQKTTEKRLDDNIKSAEEKLGRLAEERRKAAISLLEVKDRIGIIERYVLSIEKSIKGCNERIEVYTRSAGGQSDLVSKKSKQESIEIEQKEKARLSGLLKEFAVEEGLKKLKDMHAGLMRRYAQITKEMSDVHTFIGRVNRGINPSEALNHHI